MMSVLLALGAVLSGCAGSWHASRHGWHQQSGVSAYNRGDYYKAEREFTTAIAEAEYPGQPMTSLTRSISSLANLYRVVGMIDDAERLYRRALEIRLQTLGPDHPDTAVVFARLAEIYHDWGFFDQAGAVYWRALSGLSSQTPVAFRNQAQTTALINDIRALCRAAQRDCSTLDLLTRTLTVPDNTGAGLSEPLWSDPSVVYSGRMSSYALRANISGHMAVLWTTGNSRLAEDHELWVKPYEPDKKWGNHELVRATTDRLSQPQLAINETGDMVALWLERTASDVDVWSAHYTIGRGWNQPALVETITGEADHPDIAIDNQGNAVAVWSRFSGLQNDLWANRYEPGIGWNTPVLIETHDGDALRARVQISRHGHALVVWTQSGHVWANHYKSNIGWGAATAIESNSGPPSHPTVAFDREENGVAVWFQDAGVWTGRRLLDGQWESPRRIGEGFQAWSRPQISARHDGSLLAVWKESSLSNDFLVSRYDAASGWRSATRIKSPHSADIFERGQYLVARQRTSADESTLTLRVFDTHAFLASDPGHSNDRPFTVPPEAVTMPDHPDVASSLNRLGVSYLQEEAYAPAEALFRSALAMQERTLKPHDLRIARTLRLMAYTEHRQQHYAPAGPLYERALTILERGVGPTHPLVAVTLRDLAASYFAQDRFHDARSLLERQVTMLKEVGASVQTETAAALVNLARTEFELGALPPAEGHAREALLIHETAGTGGNDLSQTLKVLGGVLLEQEAYGDAESLLRRALAIDETTWGAEHYAVGDGLRALGRIASAQRRWSDATELYDRASAIFEKTVGPDHRNMALLMVNQGDLHLSQADYLSAEKRYRSAIPILEKTLSPAHPDIAYALTQLAASLRAQRKDADAESLLRRALDIREQAFGNDAQVVASSLGDLATVLIERGSYDEAESLLTRKLAILDSAAEKSDQQVADTLQLLAWSHYRQKEFALTVPLLERVLSIRERTLTSEDHRVAQALEDLAGVYLMQTRYLDADSLYRRAITILEKSPDRLFDLTRVVETYADLLWKMKRPLEAMEWQTKARNMWSLALQRSSYIRKGIL
ncbi:MAG: tetratricopeptide repeat protein [Nitrospirota bacterium]